VEEVVGREEGGGGERGEMRNDRTEEEGEMRCLILSN
jgi:hypothetical protein